MCDSYSLYCIFLYINIFTKSAYVFVYVYVYMCVFHVILCLVA